MNLKISSEQCLRNFEFWGGAKDRVKYLSDEQLDTIENMLEELYPEGMSETEVNDLFWFDEDTIAKWLGYENFDEIMSDDDVVITIPLKRYLKDLTSEWGTPEEVFVNKTIGGQIWISSEAPADLIEEYDGNKNYIEFNDSGIYLRLPKESWPYIRLKPGQSKDLKTVLLELKR